MSILSKDNHNIAKLVAQHKCGGIFLQKKDYWHQTHMTTYLTLPYLRGGVQ